MYAEFLRRHETKFILSLALIASILLTMISNPGFLYFDSFKRWEFVHLLLSGQPIQGHADNWLTIPPAFLMALCYQLTESYIFYTMVQSFIFFISIFYLFKTISKNTESTLLLCLLTVLFPVFATYAVYQAPDVFIVIGSCLFLMLSFNTLHNGMPRNTYLYAIGLFVSLFFLFGYRQNTLTLLPVMGFLFYLMYRKYKSKLLLVIQVICLIGSIALVTAIPHMMKIYKYDVSAIGFAWEIVSTLQLMKDDPVYPQYEHYLDYLGDTQKAIAQNSKRAMASAFNNGALQTDRGADPDNTGRIKKDYFKLAIEQPKYFLKNKLTFISNALGLVEPLDNRLVPDDNQVLKDYGYRETVKRNALLDRFNKFVEKNSILRKPYQLFLIPLLLMIAAGLFFRGKVNLLQYGIVYAFAVFYYIGFMITTQSHEVRYFFPSMFFLLAISFSLVIEVVVSMVKEKAWTANILQGRVNKG